jgi:hypothetical protein
MERAERADQSRNAILNLLSLNAVLCLDGTSEYLCSISYVIKMLSLQYILQHVLMSLSQVGKQLAELVKQLQVNEQCIQPATEPVPAKLALILSPFFCFCSDVQPL